VCLCHPATRGRDWGCGSSSSSQCTVWHQGIRLLLPLVPQLQALPHELLLPLLLHTLLPVPLLLLLQRTHV
jgi:hypothetical protein